jgi:HlyD family secretion protein
MSSWPSRLRAGALLAILPALAACRSSAPADPGTLADNTARAERRAFVRTIRVAGLVAASRSYVVAAPRMAGGGMGTLVVTRLVRSGTQVKRGDLLVEFDRQTQIKNAFDRRSEYMDYLAQIRKKQADQQAALARDQSELKQAANALEKAKLALLDREFVSAITAEKNEQFAQEAEARLNQLRETFDLKRRAEQADLRILEIQRDRAKSAMDQAEANAKKLTILSSIDGLVVPKQVFKGSQMGEVQEGEEVRPGLPIVEVVDASAMEVRARVNQADLGVLRIGQPVEVRLDAYPGKMFHGRLEQVAPIGVTSDMSAKVRTFAAVFSIDGRDRVLMPDLSASVDVEIERVPDVVVVPRDAVAGGDGQAVVFVSNGSSFEEREVKVHTQSDYEVAIASGLEEGAIVRRNVAQPQGTGGPPAAGDQR